MPLGGEVCWRLATDSGVSGDQRSGVLALRVLEGQETYRHLRKVYSGMIYGKKTNVEDP
jgi:hypothetical protein